MRVRGLFAWMLTISLLGCGADAGPGAMAAGQPASSSACSASTASAQAASDARRRGGRPAGAGVGGCGALTGQWCHRPGFEIVSAP